MMIRKFLVILFHFLFIFSTGFSQISKDSVLRHQMNQYSDSLAYLDAKENILVYDSDLNVMDTIYERYACSSETAQIEIIEFGHKFSLVNIQLRSACAYENKDSLLSIKCKSPLKNVKINSKHLFTYIQYPVVYNSSESNRKVVLDLVTSSNGIWPHIRDAQIIGVKPEWYNIKFRYKGKFYSGWIEASHCCPMTFSTCG